MWVVIAVVAVVVGGVFRRNEAISGVKIPPPPREGTLCLWQRIVSDLVVPLCSRGEQVHYYCINSPTSAVFVFEETILPVSNQISL